MSLATDAVVVRLAISVPPTRRQDQKRGGEVTSAAGATRRAASVMVAIFDPADSYITARSTALSRLREVHYSLTLPHLDNGPRVLAVAGLESYGAAIREAEAAVVAADDQVVAHWSDIEQAAQVALGAIFDARYVSAALKARPRIELRSEPLGDWSAGDWRVKLSEGEYSAAVASQAARDASLTASAVADVLRRVVEVLTGSSASDPGVLGRLSRGAWRGDVLAQVRALGAVLPGLLPICGGDAAVADLVSRVEALGRLKGGSGIAEDAGAVAALEAEAAALLAAARAARVALGIVEPAPADVLVLPEVVEAPAAPVVVPTVEAPAAAPVVVAPLVEVPVVHLGAVLAAARGERCGCGQVHNVQPLTALCACGRFHNVLGRSQCTRCLDPYGW
jgi:hypothetical protein